MIRRLWRPGAPHNVIAHPLLVICPPLGEWLHERTSETVPTRYAERIGREAGRGWPRRFHLFRRI